MGMQARRLRSQERHFRSRLIVKMERPVAWALRFYFSATEAPQRRDRPVAEPGGHKGFTLIEL